MPHDQQRADPLWDDVCWDMVMECEPSDDPMEGFKSPSSELVAKYVRLYPQFAEDLIDFAATSRTMDFFAAKYPAPEPNQEQIDRAVKRAMHAFRTALRRRKKQETKNAG